MQRLSYDMAADAVIALSNRTSEPEAGGAARIIACHLPIPETPDTVCLPITMTAGDLRTIYAALRARSSAPEAREDAQPFAYLVDHKAAEHRQLIYHGSFVPASDHYKITKLYTHPAPDALRAAMEALEPFAAHPDFHAGDDWPVTFVNDEERAPGVTSGDFRRARQALAALQAEQKGGATQLDRVTVRAMADAAGEA